MTVLTGWVDGQGHLKHRVSAKLETIVGHALEPGQALQNLDDGRLSQPEEVFSRYVLGKHLDDAGVEPHPRNRVEHAAPRVLGRAAREGHLVEVALAALDDEHRAVLLLGYRALVDAAFVEASEAPVNANLEESEKRRR